MHAHIERRELMVADQLAHGVRAFLEVATSRPLAEHITYVQQRKQMNRDHNRSTNQSAAPSRGSDRLAGPTAAASLCAASTTSANPPAFISQKDEAATAADMVRKVGGFAPLIEHRLMPRLELQRALVRVNRQPEPALIRRCEKTHETSTRERERTLGDFLDVLAQDEALD